MKKVATILTLLIFSSCFEEQEENDFNSIELSSSQKERLYINSVNWGVTADKQLTIVSKDKNKLKHGLDTGGCIYGLNPFIFKFSGDTLYLFHLGKKKIPIADKFNSIYVSDNSINNSKFSELSEMAMQNEKFHLVPEKKHNQYPQSMAIPPK
jgi:hypothetical protein